jgi:uncharacterized protein (TIGR01319 family)
MTDSFEDSESVLTLDLGSVHTRVSLFDVVEGKYHYIASGMSLSTAYSPFRDVNEGFYRALKNLQSTCGRRIFDDSDRLIMPGRTNGAGVDRLVVTHSVGPEIRVVVAGLLSDVSLQSVTRLVSSVNLQVAESISLNDDRPTAAKVDAIIAARPDLIVVTGGTENGASRSVYDLVEIIALVCQVLPEGHRPAVLYAGNQALAKNIKEFLEKWTTVTESPNIRPNIDQESLQPAQEILAAMVTQMRLEQLGGFKNLVSASSSEPMLTVQAFGRMVRFLSQIYDPERGVMGIDMGANATTVAAAISNNLALNTFPLGMGLSLSNVVQQSRLEDIMQWIPVSVNAGVVRDYLHQRALYPNQVPMTVEALAIEQALARHILRVVVRQTMRNWPGMKQNFEPYLITGSALTRTPNPISSLLMLLDGIQPLGLTTFVLDPNSLIASLGATASINSVLPVQVLETGAFLNLGTVISPISSAGMGSKILHVRIEYDDGNTSQFDVRKGTLVNLPIQPGQSARIHLEASRRTVIDPNGSYRTGSYKIVGGVCGAIIDARGRPIALPVDEGKRRELLQKWSGSLGIDYPE